METAAGKMGFVKIFRSIFNEYSIN